MNNIIHLRVVILLAIIVLLPVVWMTTQAAEYKY